MKTETKVKKRDGALARVLILIGATVLICLAFLAPTIYAALTYPGRTKSGPHSYDFTKEYTVRRHTNPHSGVNFGLAFQGENEGDYGVVYGESDFDAARDAGFHYIRIHADFLPQLSKTEDGYEIDETYLPRLDWAIGNVLDRGMTAILDFNKMIPDDQYAFHSAGEKVQAEARFLAVWGILSDRYRDYPPELYFELANEPHRPVTPELWNTYVSDALTVIRQSGGNNAERMVVAGTDILIGRIIHAWDQVNGIKRLKLPTVQEDPNIMVTFHYYNPYPFTHQEEVYTDQLKRASWMWKGNLWNGTEKQKAYVQRDFDTVAAWAKENGRRVIIGEFGVSKNVDIPSAARWTRLVREEAEARDMDWVFWDFYDQDSLGALYDQSAGYWRGEILDALLPADEWADETFDAASYIQGLIGKLSDPEWTVRKEAAMRLSLCGPQGDAAIPGLIRVLTEDEEWQVQKEAARALGNFGPAASSALPALTEKVTDAEWQLREQAIDALGSIGEASDPALPDIMSALSDEEWKVRKSAVIAIASIAPTDAEAGEALEGMLADPEIQVRDAAREALDMIAGGEG